MASDDAAIENFQTEPEKPIVGVTLQQLEALVSETYKLQDECDAIETSLKEKQKILNNCKGRLLSIFQEFNKSNYRTHRGLIIRQKRFTVMHPKDPASKKAFFDWLKQKKVFEEVVTVHSQTLNSLYKAEMQAAIDAGQTDFSIPGIEEPKYVETLALRRK